MGWVELSKAMTLEPWIVDSEVDPWLVVEVRAAVQLLPHGSSVVVAGGRYTALLCALLTEGPVKYIQYTDDPDVVEDVAARARTIGISSRIETRHANLEYKIVNGVEGYVYVHDLVAADVPLLVVSGPQWSYGPKSRHLVIEGFSSVMAAEHAVIASDPEHHRFLETVDAWRSAMVGRASIRRATERRLAITVTQ